MLSRKLSSVANIEICQRNNANFNNKKPAGVSTKIYPSKSPPVRILSSQEVRSEEELQEIIRPVAYLAA